MFEADLHQDVLDDALTAQAVSRLRQALRDDDMEDRHA